LSCGRSRVWRRLRRKGHFSVNEATDDTDVEPKEVQEAELVIAPDIHSQVSDEDVLEAAHDGGGEC